MSKFDKALVEKLANLAKMPLNDKQKENFSKELSTILDFVDQISKIPNNNKIYSENISGLLNVTRDDSESQTCLTQKDVLQNASSTQEGSFKVKAILENS